MTRYAYLAPRPQAFVPARVAMLVANGGVGDSRVMKEAESLAEAGHEVTVFCLAQHGAPMEERIAGVRYVRLAEWHRGGMPAARPGAYPAKSGTPNPLKALIAPYVQHELHIATFSKAVSRHRPDIVHAHDFETLPAAVVAAERCGAHVVYDMHELEEGRLPQAGPILSRWKSAIERRYIKRVAATLTVSPSIARYKARKYNIPLPAVVLNAPVLSANHATGPGLRERCGLSPEAPLAVYVGLVAEGRGVATLCEAASRLPDLHLAILGPVRASMEAALQAAKARLGDRLHVLAPVPHDQVVSHIASADMGVATIPASCLSYEYCLPNKLFEMTLAGLPTLVSSTTEMRGFATETGTGLVAKDESAAAIADGLTAVYEARRALRPGAAKLALLRDRFSWRRQADTLLDIYSAISIAPAGLPVELARHALTAGAKPAEALAVGA